MKRFLIFLATIVAACTLLCACSQESSKSSAKSLGDVWDKIKSEVSFENFSEFDDAKKLSRNYGITEEMADEFAGGVNKTGVNQEEIVLIKAKSSEYADDIEKKLNAKLQSKLNQNKNYNPEQAKMMDGCKVERNGLYVSLIVSENREKITEIYKNELKL